MNIDELIEDVIAVEGGYSNHPADRGGPTRYGVTQEVARRHGYTGDMRAFPYEEAVAIYKRQYWIRPGFERVARAAPKLGAELFDTGTNMGPGVAAGFLQRSLNALNRNGRDYADIAVDRAIGPKTLHALDRLLNARAPRGEAVLLKAVEALQGSRYIRLAEQRPANEAFLYGWFANRIGTGLDGEGAGA